MSRRCFHAEESSPRTRQSSGARWWGAKLRITAAALGCASQKDLCARFREVNPATIFELDRSYKWMQGRALPRGARLYEDWEALLNTGRPVAYLQSCSVDEFLDLVCGRFGLNRQALMARAGLDGAPLSDAARQEPQEALPGARLPGVYVCYSHAWSPYFEGRISRGSLAIEAAGSGPPALLARYAEKVSLGRLEVRGPITIAGRSAHVDLAQPVEFRLTMTLFLPWRLAGALAGVMSGISWVDAELQPAATRILVIRVPGATAEALEATNRYLSRAEEPISGDLAALGLRPTKPAELDALLDGFLLGHPTAGYIKVSAREYSELALAIDRLIIDSGLLELP